MTPRRTFLAYAVGMLASVGIVDAQKAGIVVNGKAVACDNDPIQCPNGHKTCPTIDAALVVGGGTYQNPDVTVMSDVRVICCDVCGVFFKRK